MRTGNKAVRDTAIPFISEYLDISPFPPIYGEDSLLSPTSITSTSQTAAVPMTRPAKGDIVEAYLYMEMTAPSDQPLKIYLGIGTFATPGSLIPNTVYSEPDIIAMHRKITGSDSPLQVAANGTLFVDADLTRSIPKVGETGYDPDAFVLLVSFRDLPNFALGYGLEKFKLSCSAQMGLST